MRQVTPASELMAGYVWDDGYTARPKRSWWVSAAAGAISASGTTVPIRTRSRAEIHDLNGPGNAFACTVFSGLKQVAAAPGLDGEEALAPWVSDAIE